MRRLAFASLALIMAGAAAAAAAPGATRARAATSCGAFTGPRWTDRMSPYARRGHPESGTRYLLSWRRDNPTAGPPRCAWARAWATKIIRQHPRRLYPTTPESDFLPPPKKDWVCAGGDAGGRFRLEGRYAVVGGCHPNGDTTGFYWRPDDTRDRVAGG